jgi:sterol desaturase/sphingolipid hydroxylase (fatty acid hydroxylase superfamily)
MNVMFGTIILLAILERIPRLQRRRARLFRPGAFTDLLFFVVGWLAIAQLTLAWVGGASGTVRAWLGIPAVPVWVETIVAVVLLDLGNYTAHWLMHRYGTLWRFHAVHHSSPMLDWLATFRSHFVEQAFRRVVAPLLLIAAGISLPAVAIASAIFIAWAILVHANLRVDLRLLEPIFITPRLHQLHHMPAFSDRNLGTVLNVWDRLTGRFITTDVPSDLPLGNGHRDYPQTFLRLLRQPFRPTTG